jgi:rhamnosyltransferase
MIYKIYALVTIYYPDNEVFENVSKISKQVTTVIIADNTPNSDNFYLFCGICNIIYINNENNFGLSKAFNKLLDIEFLKSSDFIFFFDQDSDIAENLIEILINDYLNISHLGFNIGCLGPIIFEKNTNTEMIPKKKICITNNIYSVATIITSSMLTTYENLEKIGFWNEDIFLDFADWDLCWRFQKNGLMCFLSENVSLIHKLGNSITKIGKHDEIEGNPIREYYQTRDGIKLLFKSYTPFKYRIHFLILIFIRPFLHIVLFKDRILRMKYISIGIVDFLVHKNGALI